MHGCVVHLELSLLNLAIPSLQLETRQYLIRLAHLHSSTVGVTVSRSHIACFSRIQYRTHPMINVPTLRALV